MQGYLSFIKLLLLYVILLAPRVHAEQTLVFGVMDIEFPPYQYIVDGKQSGPDADIIREVFDRLPDYKLTYKVRPVKRVAKEIKNGTLDITAIFKTPQREKFALFTQTPIHWSTYKLATLKGNEFAFSQVKDLYGMRIGMMLGNKISVEFDKAVEDGNLNVSRVSSFEKTLKLLEKLRVRAVVGNVTITQYYANKLGITDKITILPTPIRAPKAFRLTISKNSGIKDPVGLQQKLEAALSSMLDEGVFDDVYARHGLLFERHATDSY